MVRRRASGFVLRVAGCVPEGVAGGELRVPGRLGIGKCGAGAMRDA